MQPDSDFSHERVEPSMKSKEKMDSPAPARRAVLLLQGPVGPFFSRFGDDLEARGFDVFKVNFNGGDKFFYSRSQAFDYTEKFGEWEAYLERLIVNKEIGRIYLFGDCRAYHRVAKRVAARHDTRVFVFEEGYIRPNYITLEEGGVNGNSRMLEGVAPFSAEAHKLPDESASPKHVFMTTAIFSMIYYWASAYYRSKFEHYQHHRPFEWFSEGSIWIRSGIRKWRYARRERGMAHDIISQFDKNYFMCPLQVHCDMQVLVHSDYNSIEHFIGDVLTSFAEHAPENKAIVFKHHPLDRGYTDYTVLIANLVGELGLQGRVFYVHDICLPTLLKHAEGSILINSTVGMSSLFHGTPVKTLGKAVYDLPGLTSQLPLDLFWSEPGAVDVSLYQNYRKFLIMRNQLNGNLYRAISDKSAAGIVWSEQISAQHQYTEYEEEARLPRLRVVGGGSAVSRSSSSDDAEAA